MTVLTKMLEYAPLSVQGEDQRVRSNVLNAKATKLIVIFLQNNVAVTVNGNTNPAQDTEEADSTAIGEYSSESEDSLNQFDALNPDGMYR
ncbi:hypothetical protein PS15m_009683 [Mucor circinelloides]